MKYAVALGCLVFFCGCGGAFYREGMLKEARYIGNHAASVKLAYVGEDGVAITSGVVLDKRRGLILSVAHGIDLSTTRIFFGLAPGYEKGRIPAKLIAVDHNLDLAIFYVDPRAIKFAHEVKIALANGSEIESVQVYLVSYPLGILPHVPTFGYIIGIFPAESRLGGIGYPHLAVDIFAQPGSSGGALFLQKTHELVGLVRFYAGGDLLYPMMLFIPPEKIRQFLEENKIEYNG
jgi:S1-C subfamily serine protease